MILLVGDKPSKRSDPLVPFKGAACEKRLMEWIEYIGARPYIIINSSEPECLDMAAMYVMCGAPVVALGNVASKMLKGYGHFKLPHPSGRNRQINDKEFIQNKLDECKTYLKEHLNA